MNDIKAAENLANESLKNFELQKNNSHTKIGQASQSQSESQSEFSEEKEAQKVYVENKITRKISSVLEFLAEIYELKQEYVKLNQRKFLNFF